MGGPRIDWESVKDRLGQELDRVIADELGCSLAAVRNKRYELGIESKRGRQRINSKLLETLRERGAVGTATELAAEFNVSPQLIRHYRKKLGIKVKMGRPKGVPGKRKVEPWHELLGQVPDAQLAAKANVTHQRIQQLRKRDGIPSYRSRHPRVDWSEWDALLGTETDRVIAERCGVYGSAISRRRRQLGIKAHGPTLKTYPFDDLLGKQSDMSISKQFKMGLGTVRRRRVILGIPPWRRRVVVDWEKWKSLMETMPDDELAKRIGCNKEILAMHRRAFGIHRPRGRCGDFDHEKLRRLAGTMSDTAVAKEVGCSSTTVIRFRKRYGVKAFKETKNA